MARDKQDPEEKKLEWYEKEAAKYVPAIQNMLLFESAPVNDIKAGVEKVQSLMHDYKDAITAHQVRNIFSLVKGIKENDVSGLHMLRPKLAYIGARQKVDDAKVVVTVLDMLIKSIAGGNDDKDTALKIRGLQKVMESIVAYHKFYSNK